MVSDPELARLVKEFENSDKDQHTQLPHHEQSHASQTRFKIHVSTLVTTIEELGNPFEETSEDLVSLMSKDIADTSMCTTLCKTDALGNEQYTVFVRERLIDRLKPLKDSIPRINLCLWASSAKTKPDRDKLKLKSARADCQLFSKLYIGCQNREGNLGEFFSHDNQGSPSLRQASKSDLLPCIEKMIETSNDKLAPSVLILDEAAIVQMLKPRLCKNFLENSDKIFLPYLSSSMENVQRLDVVWDEYLAKNLKAATRAQRGKGARKRALRQQRYRKTGRHSCGRKKIRRNCLHFCSSKLVKLIPMASKL